MAARELRSASLCRHRLENLGDVHPARRAPHDHADGHGGTDPAPSDHYAIEHAPVYANCHTNFYEHLDSYGNRDTDRYSNRNLDVLPYCYMDTVRAAGHRIYRHALVHADGLCHSVANAVPHTSINCNSAAHVDAVADVHCYRHRHSNSHFDSNRVQYAHADADRNAAPPYSDTDLHMDAGSSGDQAFLYQRSAGR